MKKLSKNKSKNPMKIKLKDNKSKMKKHKIKFTPAQPPKEKVMIVAQELKFARLLAGNEKKSRDRVLKALKKWLNNCFEKGYEFKEDDFIRIWKGLFYAVWMSDKPLVQEELCEDISSLLDLFPPPRLPAALQLARAGLRVLAGEWFGIDQHRIDKFLMLVRRYLRGALRCVRRAEWSEEASRAFGDMLGGEDGLFAPQTPSFARNALSLQLHVADCFLEEVAKVSQGEIPESSLLELLRPFVVYLSRGAESRAAAACRRLLTQLARMSDAAVAGEDKRRAWRQMGCPEGGPDALELASDDEEEEEAGSEEEMGENAPLDPRAGRVSVCLPPLPPCARGLQALLADLLRPASGAARHRVQACLDRFKKIQENKYPFPDLDVVDIKPDELRWNKDVAANELKKFEREVVADPTRDALYSLSRRRRKKLLAKARLGAGIVAELRELGAVAAGTNGQWSVEESPSQETPSKKKQKRKSTEETTASSSPPKKAKTAGNSEKQANKDKKSNKNKENTQQNAQKSDKVKSPKAAENKQKIVKDSPTSVANTTKKGKVAKVTESAPRKTEVVKDIKKKVEKIAEKPKEKLNYGKPDKVKLVKANAPKTPKGAKSPKTEEKEKVSLNTPKRVKFVLKNNSKQEPIDYYKSIRASPSIPFDGTKQPARTNLKPNAAPSPINPFFKKKLRLKI